MTNLPDDLPLPTGWTVMETDTADLLLLPVWVHRDNDDDEITVFIAHPGGVVVDDSINPAIGDLRHSALCVLAACQSVSAQRVRGQEAVRELLDRYRPAGNTHSLEDLIAQGVQAERERQAERSKARAQGFESVSQLFADLKEQIDRLNKDKPQDGDQS